MKKSRVLCMLKSVHEHTIDFVCCVSVFVAASPFAAFALLLVGLKYVNVKLNGIQRQIVKTIKYYRDPVEFMAYLMFLKENGECENVRDDVRVSWRTFYDVFDFRIIEGMCLNVRYKEQKRSDGALVYLDPRTTFDYAEKEIHRFLYTESKELDGAMNTLVRNGVFTAEQVEKKLEYMRLKKVMHE